VNGGASLGYDVDLALLHHAVCAPRSSVRNRHLSLHRRGGFDRIGGSHSWVLDVNENTLTQLRTQLDEATLEEAREYGRRLTVDEAVAFAVES
jgi:hypothetical protein